MKEGGAADLPVSVLFLAEHLDAPEAEMILRLHRAGERVALMAAPERRFCGPLLAAGIPVADLPPGGWRSREGERAIAGMLDAARRDILHALQNRPLAIGLRAARGRGLRTVAYRGAMHLSWRALLRYCFGGVDRVVCISQAARRRRTAFDSPVGVRTPRR